MQCQGPLLLLLDYLKIQNLDHDDDDDLQYSAIVDSEKEKSQFTVYNLTSRKNSLLVVRDILHMDPLVSCLVGPSRIERVNIASLRRIV